MTQPGWLVVLHWLGPNTTEFSQSAAFPTYEQAHRQITQLASSVGTLVNGRLLKSVAIVGDYQSVWKGSASTLEPTQ